MEQATTLGLLTTDRQLLVRSWNGWLAAATGLAEERVAGQPLADLIPPDRRDLYREILTDVLERGTPRVLAPAFHQYLFACAPASPSPHFDRMQQRVTVAPLRADGDVVGVMVTIEDMTAQLDEQRALAARIEQSGTRPAPRDALMAVGANDWRVRGAAVRWLRQSASAEDVAHLLSSLERDHHNLAVLSSALRVLVSANRDVLPALIALLSDSHPNLRMHAALALGELRDPDAVAPLMKALDDPDPNVRFHAIEALGHLAPAAAVEPLTRIAQSGDFFLSFPAIDALARTDDARVAPTLVGLLDTPMLRPAVIDTLAAIGDEDSVPALAGLLNCRAGDPAQVAAALDRIRDRYDRTFAAGDQIIDGARAAITDDGFCALADAIERRDAPLAPLVSVYGWRGAAATNVLVRLVGDPAVHAEAARGVLAIGRPAVYPLIAALADGERSTRLAAAELLGRLGDRRAVPPLAELLRDVDADLAVTATAALAALGDPAAIDNLLPLFAHPQGAVRQAAVAAVNAIGTARVESPIRERLSDGDARVRACAVRVAGYFGLESCVPQLLTALADADEDVRRAAIEQLPVVEVPQAAARLATALARETPRNRAAAAHAARLADDRSLDAALVTALADADPWVRYFAASSLGERRAASAVNALTTIAVGDPATQVRIAAIQAAGAIDPEAAVPLALRLLTEADTDLACAALTAVARGASTRVDDLLERAIRAGHVPVARCAIDALAARTTVAAVDTLAWAARLTDAPALSGAAIDALASIAGRDGDAGRAAAAALVDIAVEPARRSAAIEGLARQTGATMDVVVEALADPRPAARLTAAEALARMRHPRASAALVAALRDEDAAVRSAAVSGFGRLGTPAAAAVITALRDSDPDPAVRRKAAIVCRRYGWPQ